MGIRFLWKETHTLIQMHPSRFRGVHFEFYGVQKKNPTLPDTIVSELEWDYEMLSKNKNLKRLV